MSVLSIRNDDNCDLYNRTIVVCYTRMTFDELRTYVTHLELFAEDRQKIFFKIDIDIFSVPESAPEARPGLRGWRILTIVLKAQKLSLSFGVLVKLFYEKFPHPMMVDYSNSKIFVSSGAFNVMNQKQFTEEDSRSFSAILDFHERVLGQSYQLPKIFKDTVDSPSEAPKMLVRLAKQYHLKGGYWIMFFNNLPTRKWEKVFDELLAEAFKHWGVLVRFNARISADTLIICFGNEKTVAASDPKFFESSEQQCTDRDPGASHVLCIIENIYKPNIFGTMDAKYKLDIVSACCIQRDNFIRPTVYQANFGFGSNHRSVPMWGPVHLPWLRHNESYRRHTSVERTRVATNRMVNFAHRGAVGTVKGGLTNRGFGTFGRVD